VEVSASSSSALLFSPRASALLAGAPAPLASLGDHDLAQSPSAENDGEEVCEEGETIGH
jgi:hypothetical protein